MTLQEMIEALNRYWSEQGCLLQQPCDLEVGAGTFNPATSLRCLGPEPFDVAYVEPSRRPADGRYGENPYKAGHYYQYQVILKPAPENSQELYLNSLEALGLNLQSNDIRFVEDDWESPTLGASGLGWEIWCNGAEVTQYTYFQQMGGMELDPICVELTYGLERVAMYLQEADSIFDIRWNDETRYREIHHQTEAEYTAYYKEKASAEMLTRWFNDCEREGRMCVEAGLVWPAMDYTLKASHIFNVLDARGAISVSERVGYIARVRALARKAAQAYLVKREEMGYPLLKKTSAPAEPAPPKPAPEPDAPTADMLFEIGCEELPASYIEPALQQMRGQTEAWLKENRLERGEISTLATPRRLVLHIENLATVQEDMEAEIGGPPAAAAYGADGMPTRAAEGFARSQGASVSDLYIKETEKGRYVFARKQVKGLRAADLLAEYLPRLASELRFPKSMRWGEPAHGLRFARPIRWMTALLGEHTIDFPFGSFRSGRKTQGHRFLSKESIRLPNASLEGYKAALEKARVVVNQTERRRIIREGVERAFKENGSGVQIDEALLDEVLYLVESPEFVVGEFDARLLEIPQEALTAAMKKDQRYFPMYREDGSLLPRFVAVSNGTAGESGPENARRGNERVLRARLENAGFFWKEDLKRSLGERVEDLRRVTFQESLGSLYDKMIRRRSLADWIAPQFNLSTEETEDLQRAAELADADLTTLMVSEFAELQGVIGRRYALEAGECRVAADALRDRYAAQPETKVGAALAVVDKIDTIAGYFGIGQKPTGSQDPYSLRRHAIDICRILMKRGSAVSLSALIERACGAYEAESPAEEIRAFFIARLEGILYESGYARDEIAAVLSVDSDRLSRMTPRLDALRAFRRSALFEEAYPAFNRLLRILPGRPTDAVPNPAKYLEEEERALDAHFRQLKTDGDYGKALEALAGLAPHINRFFDNILVMDKDKAVRRNRLALAEWIARSLLQVGDFTKLEVSSRN